MWYKLVVTKVSVVSLRQLAEGGVVSWRQLAEGGVVDPVPGLHVHLHSEAVREGSMVSYHTVHYNNWDLCRNKQTAMSALHLALLYFNFSIS